MTYKSKRALEEKYDIFIKNRHAIKHGLKYDPYKEATD